MQSSESVHLLVDYERKVAEILSGRSDSIFLEGYLTSTFGCCLYLKELLIGFLVGLHRLALNQFLIQPCNSLIKCLRIFRTLFEKFFDKLGTWI